MSGLSCEVFGIVNQMRARYRVAPLAAADNCIQFAESHAQDEAANGFIAHDSPTNGTFQQRVQKFGIRGGASENLAKGSGTAANIVNLWMASQPNRATMLAGAYRSGGVGVAQDAQGKFLYVECYSTSRGGP
jgi:uncharacterized protein YkwD